MHIVQQCTSSISAIFVSKYRRHSAEGCCFVWNGTVRPSAKNVFIMHLSIGLKSYFLETETKCLVEKNEGGVRRESNKYHLHISI